MKLQLSLSLLAALALSLPAAADAYRAETTAAVNMRAGGGTDHARIATLPAGTPVWVEYCREGWCAVNARGVEGWVSGRYIGGSPAPTVRPYRPTVIETPPAPPPLQIYPRRPGYHDYGYGRYHQPNRQFHP